jgi:hypothetical protein
MTIKPIRSRAIFVMAGALVAAAGAAAGQQQASFAVAVTLHTAVKPLSAAELCRDGRPITTLGATIQVACPKPAAQTQQPSEGTPEPSATRERQSPPEVTVTF